MNNEIINEISENLNIKKEGIEAVLKLLKEGNTVPFIARYRKEATGALDEEQIRSINEYYEYQVNLLKRKEDVIRLIDEKGLLTDELKDNIMKASKLVEVEDIYRPYKEKKKTKATEAIKNGLEPLAKIIMSFKKVDIKKIAESYLNDNVKSVDEAITNAGYIIADWISDKPKYRKSIRNYYWYNGLVKGKLKKGAFDEAAAEAKFEAWMKEKEAKRQAKIQKLAQAGDAAAKAALEAEAKVRAAKEEIIAKKSLGKYNNFLELFII